MVKVSSMDIVAILRRFSIANEENVPRHIEQVQITNPTPLSTLVTFRFAKKQYFLLFDDTAQDSPEYVLTQVRTDDSKIVGSVVKNPNNHLTEYALPFKGKDVYVFIVQSQKRRLDSELAERYPDMSRSTWQKHIKAGHVTVNGDLQLVPKSEVTSSDSIAVSLPESTDFSKSELPIIYLDDNVIVVNKPIGVLTHSKGALNDEFTVADFFRRYTTYGLDSDRPGIIHRLDRDTSGIIIGARHQRAADVLNKQFADRKTKKTYIAITDGIPKNSTARIDLPIGRNPTAPSTFRVDTKGKDAVTDYIVLDTNDTLSLVELKPVTGRTHQLRVHMDYINAPILGDRVYGKAKDRLYLHARKLEITIPEGDRRVFESPLPKEFTNFFPKAS